MKSHQNFHDIGGLGEDAVFLPVVIELLQANCRGYYAIYYAVCCWRLIPDLSFPFLALRIRLNSKSLSPLDQRIHVSSILMGNTENAAHTLSCDILPPLYSQVGEIAVGKKVIPPLRAQPSGI